MLNRRSLTILLGVLLLAVSIYSLTIPSSAKSLICSQTDPKDCYPKLFEPSKDWKIIREGQETPPGLDFRIDLETGLKEAKLLDNTASNNAQYQEVAIKEAIEKTDGKQIVSYSSEDIQEDSDITALKMAVQGADTQIDVHDALSFLSESQDEKKLLSSLDSLTDHSHNLKDGVLISEPENFNNLVDLATSKSKYTNNVHEMASRVIAQALRHNPKALSNIDAGEVLPKFLNALKTEDNSVLQKRFLGVISSVVQTDSNSLIFKQLGGQDLLLDSFSKLQEDSKVRALEILDDVKRHALVKRDEDNDNAKIFQTIQRSLANKEVQDDHALEQIFDRAVALKKENKQLKSDPSFMEWLSEEVQTRKLAKRDDETNDDLHQKLLEARHVVFGNPNALRKAMADEL